MNTSKKYINLLWFHLYIWKNGRWWFRLFGFGISATPIKKANFSERNLYSNMLVYNKVIYSLLTPFQLYFIKRKHKHR